MTLYDTKKFRWSAFAALLVFSVLLGYRVIFFNGTFRGITSPDAWQAKPLEAGESWMNVFQNGRKIGFTRRILETIGEEYRIQEETVMNINTMGMTQEIRVKSVSTTGMDFAFKSFDFEIASGSFDFSLKGEIKNNVLYLSDGSTKIPLENRPYLASGITQAVVASGLEEGQEMIIFVFDPSTLGQAPAEIKVLGEENIIHDGNEVKTRKILLRFRGSKQFAWLDEAGNVIKEQGMLGITLVKTDREGALDGLPLESSEDLTRLASVASNKTFENPEKLDQLKVKIRNIDDLIEGGVFSLNQGRQKWENGTLTITKEFIINDQFSEKAFSEAVQGIDPMFRDADTFIQSDHPKIKNIAERIVKQSDPPLEKVKKFVAWIQQNIKRQPVLSMPNALSTLENRMGDCNEHAALFAAFCRAAGIPAKIEAGLVYLNGRFYYHAWNLVFVEQWITVDSLFNQIPADVTHITFSSGSQDLQLDLLGMMGKVELEIID
ncbi:conserved hypothetical protein [Desulfamplus magnetovallimortis]|uniref:Transglutaminase-like domain-containing protein n=1 Tax=Desulfamplus magnetovallimortis TaxID=1246637 RepID=A0A1W1HAU8_9BACT|nr:transglutaminase-like domain-containing protein [Desulfamplus magnetovallimortis]SLM29563.1 conserved hypothetical protein [Desulfamplus magnetovallimortis]